MKSLRSAAALLRLNGKSLLLFELVYKLTAAALFVPAFKLLFGGLMRLTGRRYLTVENIGGFLLHPCTLLAAFFLLLLIGLFMLTDMAVVIFLMNQAAAGQRCGALYALRQVLKSERRVLRPGLAPMSLYLLFMALFLHLGMIAGVMVTVRIPVIVSGYILRNPPLWAGLAAFLLLSGYLLLRLIYALPVCLLRGVPFASACRSSFRMTRKGLFSDARLLFMAQTGLIALFLLLSAAAILALRLISRPLARSFLTAHVMTLLTGILLLITILSVPVLLAVILTCYFRRLKESRVPMPQAVPMPPDDPRRRKLRLALCALAVCLALAGGALVVYRYQRGHYNLDIEYFRSTEVTAHRGASAHAPENTMAAFTAAWEQGADWIELDVRQSRDGQVFCLHDSNLSRMTGLNRRAWEMTWEELSALDAGSRFGKDFAGERFALLEEVIDFASLWGVRLNIELKPTVHDAGLAQAVADLIRERGFEDQCVVTCQNYYTLEKLKEYAPELTTVYVVSVAYGNLDQLQAADHFSVAYSYISRDMVSRLHRAGKQVYAWTVDRADIMQRMIDLGVDNIITNDVALGVATVRAASASDIVQTLVEEFAEPAPEENAAEAEP